jgi:rRNA maturation protein Nop10
MNLEDFKKAFPYICESCREFTHSFVEYCEHCGKRGVVRKANEFDYEENSFKRKISVISEEKSSKQKTPVISEEEIKK